MTSWVHGRVALQCEVVAAAIAVIGRPKSAQSAPHARVRARGLDEPGPEGRRRDPANVGICRLTNLLYTNRGTLARARAREVPILPLSGGLPKVTDEALRKAVSAPVARGSIETIHQRLTAIGSSLVTAKGR